MQPVLLDSSVYIGVLRAGGEALDALRWKFPQVRVWLSAVVLEELYAGASGSDRRLVEQMEREFDRVGRILVPNLRDWTRAGQVLAQLAAGYGYERIGQQRLTNDALIAMSAARQGITVVTANERDFGRLAKFRPFRYEVRSI
jgi:predicted nucleic acid-binding protein